MPWTSTFPQTANNSPGNFPAYFSPQFMDLRPQTGALFLQSKATLSGMDVLSGKESTHLLLADRVLPDLINAANLSRNTTAQAAAAILASWDRNADATSQGAVLFEAWWALVTSQTPADQCPSSLLPLPTIALDNTINLYSRHPQFRIGWNAANPVNTPAGLANPAATVPYLICAAALVQAAYGALGVPWGAVHGVVLATHDPTFQTVIPLSNAPQSGADDPFGPLRVLFRFPAPDGKHFFPVGGDGYVQLVEFTQGGANAQALLAYGNASRPGSPHITDQLSYFEAKTLRPVFRKRSDVEAHAVSREVVY